MKKGNTVRDHRLGLREREIVATVFLQIRGYVRRVQLRVKIVIDNRGMHIPGTRLMLVSRKSTSHVYVQSDIRDVVSS